ncbi:MAG: HTTM domain-containing protein [Actinomycetota bacterium]|nr:HTTM domain-containing protein [Actinomycetota bacterium]
MSNPLVAWDRFWFTSRSASTAALVRIWGALVLLGWGLTMGADLLSFFGPHGIQPRQPNYKLTGLKGIWSVLGPSPTGPTIAIVYGLFLLGALCLLVGFHSRLAALVVFVGMVSFTRRDPLVANSGDALLRVLCFYLLLVPGGAALSLDRWRQVRKTGGDFWASPARAVWPLRLMQIQLSVAYLAAVWAKVGGITWRQGTAVSFALQTNFIRRLPLPAGLVHSLLLSNILTYGTLATELSLGLLVWNRRLRPRVLLVGVAFHLALDYAFRVGFFSYAMFVLYLAFVPPERVDAWLSAGRARLARRRTRHRPGDGGPGDDGRQTVVGDEGPVDDRAGVTAGAVAEPTAGADAVVGEASPGVGRG